jgi:cell division transport system permease protein
MTDEADIAEKFAVERSSGERPTAHGNVFRWLTAEPLIPDAGAGGAHLTAVIAVMAFLASLALAGFLFIADAASRWTNELESGITIQVKGADATEIAKGTESALRVLESTPGVRSVRALPPEEGAKLLEPWLGKGNVTSYLNIPALIEVEVDDSLRRDIEALRTRLADAAPRANLDDHGAWHERLTSAARSGQLVVFLVFLLILGAACAVAMFAARAGLAANREIISILHLVGATDAFIANEVQRRFLALGVRGSLAGLFLASLVLGLAVLSVRTGAGAAGFLPELHMGPYFFATLLAVPFSLCLVTAWAARVTVLKSLAREL